MVAFDARDFDKKMSKGVLRNVYPFLARRILERTGIKTGRCIDLGGGPGMLGIDGTIESDAGGTWIVFEKTRG